MKSCPAAAAGGILLLLKTLEYFTAWANVQSKWRNAATQTAQDEKRPNDMTSNNFKHSHIKMEFMLRHLQWLYWPIQYFSPERPGSHGLPLWRPSHVATALPRIKCYVMEC